MPIRKLPVRPASGDPIKFILQANKQTVAPGEEVTLTLTAHYYSLSPALLFVDAGANAFRLKLLMPDGFVQTGGDYVDYIGTELSSANPTITYTLKGHFENLTGKAQFRLLRGAYTADASSLFVEKARLTIDTISTPVFAQTKSARSTLCDYTEGAYLFTTSWGEAVYAHYYNNILFAALQDGNGFKPRHWLTATGQMSSTVANCFAEDDPHTSPPNNPNPNPGGNCSYSEGQYLFTFNTEVMYAHYYNGVLFAAYQDGSDFRPRHWLVATGQMSQNNANCFAETDPRSGGTNPPGNPNPSNCSVSSPTGYLDFADCDRVAGWAFDNNNLSQPVLIDIYIDGNKTYSGIVANFDRPDLVQAFGNEAARYHGYNFSFPADAPWKNGQSHTIAARICGAGQDLNNSPRGVNSCTGGTTNPPTTPTPGTGNGLSGFYTNSSNLSKNLMAIRTDAQINFTWSDSPIPGTIDADNFSIRWSGQVEAPVSGNYTFKTNNDDATHLWINGQLLINDWNGHGPTWQQGSIYLNAGQKYTIDMNFADFGGGAQAQLYWEYPGQGLQLIPSSRLYTTINLTQYTPTGPVCIKSITMSNVTYFFKCGQGTLADLECRWCGDGEPDYLPPIFVGGPSEIDNSSPFGGHHGIPFLQLSSGGGPSSAPTNQPVSNQPVTPAQSALDAFFADMLSRKIYFTPEEKALITEFPDLMNSIREYVDRYGSKPDGSMFILSDIDQLLYPKFTNLVKNNIRDYVMNNTKILNALKTFSGFNENTIRILLTFGKGPKINIKQIKNPDYWMQDGYTYGYFKWNENPNVVNIDYKTVQAYEIESHWPELEKAWFVLLANVLIHETAHYGAFKTQTLDVVDGPTSMGPHKFDIAAFGYAAFPGNVIDEIVLKSPK